MLSDVPQRRTSLGAASVAPLILLLVSGASHALSAQTAARVQAAGAERLTRRIEHITPQSGPPGTVVTVASAAMPHITPVRIGLGAIRTGFEALEELLTSVTGDFTVPVTVPEWARWDRTHRFIVFDFYFNPIALSDPFYVTNAEGLLLREGTVGLEGTCVLLRAPDGDVFSLLGTSALKEGDRVVVQAKIAEPSTCTQQPTLQVVELLNRSGPP
jgi:hypothetical protein